MVVHAGIEKSGKIQVAGRHRPPVPRNNTAKGDVQFVPEVQVVSTSVLFLSPRSKALLCSCSLVGEEIQQQCIEVAVTQAQSSQNAAMLLGMWVAPPLVYSLSVCVIHYSGTYKPYWTFSPCFACIGFVYS